MIEQLYPTSMQARPLQGCDLALNLHQQAADHDVLIYANYIASLDGRISLRNTDTGDFEVPPSIANP
ncbi:MAG: pyrimidine reductase, partial [Mariprofundaceae bacterium]